MSTVNNNKSTLTSEQREELLSLLKARFEKIWTAIKVLNGLTYKQSWKPIPDKLWSLNEMEISGGEPDLVGYDKKTDEYIFYDCSAESPKGRRSLCYDHEALEARKEFKPGNSAVNMAADMGIELLTEEQYRELQQLGNFDTKAIKLGKNAC